MTYEKVATITTDVRHFLRIVGNLLTDGYWTQVPDDKTIF